MTMQEWEAEDQEFNVVEIWPEHFQAYDLFRALRTQWRMGPNGPTGLDYNILYRDIDRLKVSDERFTELRDEVQLIEYSAMAQIHAE